MTTAIHRHLDQAPTTWWGSMSLRRQFVVAGSFVLVLGMIAIGLWVTQQIRDAVMRNAAVTTALYVDSVIAPLLPDIRKVDELEIGPRVALDETLSRGTLGERLVSFKIWGAGARILYSTDESLIGKSFAPTESLRRAWQGNVSAEFDDLDDDENMGERSAGVPLLEIYSPIRAPWSGEVVAVAEFYEAAPALAQELNRVQVVSWLVVAGVTIAMMSLLSGIVFRGSRLIADQRVALEARIGELSALAHQNEELRIRVQGASRRASELNERFLRRVSADLHDGPAQLIALAALRMGSDRLLAPDGDSKARRDEISAIRGCLDEAITEIRNICHGLTLPQIDAARTGDLLRGAVQAHSERTGDVVETDLDADLPDLAPSEKNCVYRFVREALVNAHRHATGQGMKLTASAADRALVVTIADRGPGFDPANVAPGRLGLAGLRDRVESLGGSFSITSSPAGTRVTMRLTHDDAGALP